MNGSRLHIAAAAVALGAALAAPGDVRAQDFFIGQLQQFGTNWCPDNWARADGSLVAIASNQALFALIGTTYGGNGQTTFALPDLRDRAPVGMSAARPIGTPAGQAAITLTINGMPAHTHGFFADPTPPVSNSPADSMMGVFPAGQAIYAPNTAMPNTPMNTGTAAPAGGSAPMPTQSPVLATNWCIAMYGIFPSRP